MDAIRLAAAVDATLAQVASVRSWTVTKGSFLGFTVGDSQEKTLGTLKSLGAEYVLGESAMYGPVTAASDLGRLNGYSDFLVHPINARVVFEVTTLRMSRYRRSVGRLSAMNCEQHPRDRKFSHCSVIPDGRRSVA
jgi:hypothetical protein